MTDLVVTVFDEECGRIVQADGTLEYEFSYLPEWRVDARHGISLSMPRGIDPTPDRSRAYFGGLLPEGAARRHIAQASGIDELDDVALLRRLGEECPGAIRVYTPARFDQVLSERRGDGASEEIRWLDHDGELDLIGSLRVPGSARSVERYSISLAGAQLKRGVRVDIGEDGGVRVEVPSGDDRSTHILKLAVADFVGIVQNEHATMRLAASSGIRASRTRVAVVGGEHVLLVERYDRVVDASGRAAPLHQEDMCQALGRLASHKYERYDPVTGRAIGPTLLDMVSVLRASVRPSIQQVDELLRLFWFNVVVGNVDAHAKNYSLLYRQDLDALEMAPAYDCICVIAHHADVPHEDRVEEEPIVMNVGGCTRFWQLERGHVEEFARQLSIRPGYVVDQVLRTVTRVESALDEVLDACQADPVSAHDVLEQVRVEVRARCAFLRGVLAG